MDMSEKILDKKEELLDEFEDLKLEELALNKTGLREDEVEAIYTYYRK